MTRYVLDTNILVGYLRGADYARRAENQYRLSEPPNISVISVVTAGEIHSLAIQFGWGKKKKRRLKQIMREFPAIDINTTEVISTYAEIDAYSQGKMPGSPLPQGMTARNMGKNDLWIAATTGVVQADLITTDHHFDHLDGIFFEVRYIDQSKGKERTH